MKLSAGDGDPLTTLWDGQMCHTKGEMHFSLMSLIVPMYSRSMLCRYPKHSVYVVFIIPSVCYVAMLCLLHTLLFLMRSSISHASPFLIRPVSWSTHKHPYHHLYIYIGSLHFGCSWKINGLIFNHINILCRSSLDAFSIPSSIEKLIPWSHVVKYWKIDPA